MKKRLTPFWMHFFVSCFVMIVTITLIISVMFFCIYLNSSNKYNNNNVRNVMQYSQSVLENYFERYSKVVGNMSFAEQIYDVQNEGDDLLYNRNQKYYRILSNVFSVMNDVSSMYLYTNDGFVTRMGDSVYEEKNAKLVREKCEEYDAYNNEMWIYDDGYIVMCKDVIYFDSQYMSENLGCLIICINAEKVNSVCFEKFENENYGIIYSDAEGKIAISSDKRLIGENKEILNGTITDNLECIKFGGWNCYSYVKSFALLSGTPKIIIIMFCIDFVFILIIYAILNMLIKKVNNPMEQLLDVAKSIRKQKNGNNKNELEYISNTIEELKEDLKTEIEKNYNMKEQIKLASMKAYEGQVNPHFLYNTLQMIEMMSIVGDNKKIPVVTKSLGNMFRFSLDIKTEVKLSEEIRNSEDYFKILKLRYGENFEYKVEINKELEDCVCPKFLIQPFVENAVAHAFENKIDKWMVFVTVFSAWDNIVIIIKDNGNGITKERLEEIRKNLNDRAYNTQKHIGIKNVHERVRLLYGDNYGVEIVSDKFGTQVMINIPIKRGEEDA